MLQELPLGAVVGLRFLPPLPDFLLGLVAFLLPPGLFLRLLLDLRRSRRDLLRRRRRRLGALDLGRLQPGIGSVIANDINTESRD